MVYVILEKLPIPSIYSPSNIVPVWNEHIIDKVEAIFEFVYSLLHDDVALIVFVQEFKKDRDDVRSFVLTYNINLPLWLVGVNEMRLCSPLDNTLIVLNISKILKFMNTSLLFIANYNVFYTLHWFEFAFVNSRLNVPASFFDWWQWSWECIQNPKQFECQWWWYSFNSITKET